MKTIHHVLDIDAPAATGLGGAHRTPTAWPLVEHAGGDGPAAVGERIRFTFAGDFNPVMEITGITAGQRADLAMRRRPPKWKDNTFRLRVAPLDAGGPGCGSPRNTRSSSATTTTASTTSTGATTWKASACSPRQGPGKPFDPPPSVSPA